MQDCHSHNTSALIKASYRILEPSQMNRLNCMSRSDSQSVFQFSQMSQELMNVLLSCWDYKQKSRPFQVNSAFQAVSGVSDHV